VNVRDKGPAASALVSQVVEDSAKRLNGNQSKENKTDDGMVYFIL
jgi:hypothetical protein